jgi:hypothetical protein
LTIPVRNQSERGYTESSIRFSLGLLAQIRAEFFFNRFPVMVTRRRSFLLLSSPCPSKSEMLFNTSFVSKLKLGSEKTAKFSNEQELVRVSNDSPACKFVIPVQYLKMIEGLSRPVIDHLANYCGSSRYCLMMFLACASAIN